MKRKSKILTMIRRLPEDTVYDMFDSKTPVGEMTLVASGKALHAILWPDDWHSDEFKEIMNTFPKSSKNSIIKETKKQLMEYFKGQRQKFDLPLVMDGTDFQKSSWKVLKRIPYGKTISYQEQAIKLGDKNKVRAVGGANGRNPISIIVPCHRVVGKNGDLTGFGGGVDKKDFLLELEQKNL